MATLVRESRSTNPYIVQLREQLAGQQSTAVDWLVIAHNDPHMIQRLADCTLQVHALLYIAESGVFLAYGVQTKAFRPLMDTSSAM